jgi:hypothetical protein
MCVGLLSKEIPMRIKLARWLFLALPLAAQTIPNGAIYQAAAANGIVYISPSTGAQVLDQKAGTNWKSLLNGAAANGTIGGVVLGITKVVSMSSPWTTALLLAHMAWDQYGSSVLASAAPNPKPIVSMLLQPAQTTTLNGACVEASMFAGQSKVAKPIGAVNVAGVAVTFSPQGTAVLVDAAGSKIKGFGIWDVLICPYAVTPPAPVPSLPQAEPPPTVEFTSPGNEAIEVKFDPPAFAPDASPSAAPNPEPALPVPIRSGIYVQVVATTKSHADPVWAKL